MPNEIQYKSGTLAQQQGSTQNTEKPTSSFFTKNCRQYVLVTSFNLLRPSLKCFLYFEFPVTFIIKNLNPKMFHEKFCVESKSYNSLSDYREPSQSRHKNSKFQRVFVNLLKRELPNKNNTFTFIFSSPTTFDIRPQTSSKLDKIICKGCFHTHHITNFTTTSKSQKIILPLTHCRTKFLETFSKN